MSEVDSTIQYRDVPGFPGYRVGDDGSVWSRWRTCRWGTMLTDKWHLVKASVRKKRTIGTQYRYLNLCKDSVATTWSVHRLVLEAFVGPCPEGMESRHLDGDPGNNRRSNLAWGTPLENAQDRQKHKRYSHRNRLYTHNGQTLLLKDWARVLGVSYQALWQRITKLGMSFHEAITRPYLGVTSNGGHWKKLKRSKQPR